MDNLEKYGFCPYSDQVNLAECNPFVSVCSDCDIFFKGYDKGRITMLDELKERLIKAGTDYVLEVIDDMKFELLN